MKNIPISKYKNQNQNVKCCFQTTILTRKFAYKQWFSNNLISKSLGHKSPDVTLKVYSNMYKVYKENGIKLEQFLQNTLFSQNVVKDD